MKKVTCLMGLALIAACPMMASAQGEVYDTAMSSIDVAELKGGEWYEQETKMAYPGVDMPATKAKTACVKVDGDHVWIETSSQDAVTCYQISKKDRKIVKAWSGKAGGDGTEMTVKATPTGGAGTANYEVSGTSTGSKDKISVAGKDIDCIKVVTDTTTKMSGMEMKAKTTVWYSKDHPFKTYVDKDAKDPYEGKIKHEGDKPEGNMVKMESEASGGKTTISISGWGNDAKPTLNCK
jgi:hypothetical protein